MAEPARPARGSRSGPGRRPAARCTPPCTGGMDLHKPPFQHGPCGVPAEPAKMLVFFARTTHAAAHLLLGPRVSDVSMQLAGRPESGSRGPIPVPQLCVPSHCQALPAALTSSVFPPSPPPPGQPPLDCLHPACLPLPPRQVRRLGPHPGGRRGHPGSLAPTHGRGGGLLPGAGAPLPTLCNILHGTRISRGALAVSLDAGSTRETQQRQEPAAGKKPGCVLKV